MNGHRDDWRHFRCERSSISEHSRCKDHDFLSHTSARPDHTRKLRESYWIRRLHTLAPFGIKQGNLLCVLSHDCRFGVLYCCRHLHRILKTLCQSFLLYKLFLKYDSCNCSLIILCAVFLCKSGTETGLKGLNNKTICGNN